MQGQINPGNINPLQGQMANQLQAQLNNQLQGQVAGQLSKLHICDNF